MSATYIVQASFIGEGPKKFIQLHEKIKGQTLLVSTFFRRLNNITYYILTHNSDSPKKVLRNIILVVISKYI